jgi:hypothetical protein
MVGTVFQRIGSIGPSMLAAVALAVPILLGGCNESYNAVQRDLSAMHAAGRYDAAAALLDDPKNQQAFGQKSRLVYLLDRGSIALAQKQLDPALDDLDRAESFMELHRDPTAGDEVSKWLVNDTAATYYGEPYEEIYVNVLKLAARLERGEIDGGATVEARRMAGKADVLRDRYLKSLAAVNEKGGKEVQGWSGMPQPPRGPAAPVQTTDGQFIESPLGLYLSAIAFMKSGDPELQSVVSRRLNTAISAQRGLIGPVRPEDFGRLGELVPDDANALFVALSGRGPTKVPKSFGPIPIYTYTIYFELPELEGGSAEADEAVVVFEDEPSRPPLQLSFVEDMRSVAKANHEQQLPLIYARAYLRSSLKAAAVAVGTEAARRGTKNNDSQTAIEIAGIIGGLLFVTQTEKADLRCWTFLPGQAHVGLAKLAPGEHRVHIDYLRGGQRLYSTPSQTMRVGGGRNDLSTVVGHFWR